MRNQLNLLTPVLAAVLASGALAAPGTANASPRGTTSKAAGQRTPTTQTQAPTLQVTYYRGDPLQGGQRLGTTATATAPRGDLFQNAPTGATHAVITTPAGQQVVNLQDVQNRTAADQRAAGDQDRDGDRASRQERSGAVGQTQRAAPTADRAPEQRADRQATAPQARSTLDGLGRALRRASRVTFYTADPLKGGQVIGSVTLSGNAEAQQAALTQGVRQAKFAVVERNGTREIVDLSAASTPPQQAAPQGPQRR